MLATFLHEQGATFNRNVITMHITNENLFKHSLAEGINLFIGAGFSVEAFSLAETNKEKALPVGDGLRQELLVKFDRKRPSTLNLAQLCQILGSGTTKNDLIAYFKQRFTVTRFEKEYYNLERVNIKAIFTTNIDDLVFKVFSESTSCYVNDIVLRGPAISGSNAIDYIALHGCVKHGDDEFAFSPIEISSSFERDKDKWFGYVGRIQTTPTLYWGYRVEDAGVLQALAKETTSGRSKADAWIVLRDSDEEAIEYYTSLGFQIIVGDTLELLKYFGQLRVQKQPGASKSLLLKNFVEYQIPSVDKVPVRSLSEFYLGAEPIWYDIYSGKIHETSHFTSARNELLGGRHVIVLGGPVTGKTTLLKQLATRLTGIGIPLYIDEISLEKAQLLRRDIEAEGQKVILYIDNAADAVEAIQAIQDCASISIVAAERDYVFDSVSHRFSKFKILDISGLSDIDTQSVQNHIPKDIKRRPYLKDQNELDADTSPTLFDVITATITADSLADRFIDAIRQLKQSNPAEHDLLLMGCYLYASRVPISVDVAASFSRRYALPPQEILRILDSMPSLLSRYEGALAESDQAYFVPRSRNVAEVVIRRVNAFELKAMLEIFHSEVSPTKIPRYDIFRRNAYDAKIIGRAFPNWEEGLKFYDNAFLRDRTHSLKQQGALYLAQKKNYLLAFSWIDEAMQMTGGNNPTVRNSYAVILFNANYDKPESADVVASLDKSMQTLQKCHRDDYRKVYHAKIFAEQALKYAKKLPFSSNQKDYLKISEEWLTAELRVRPGDRWMSSLVKQVKRTIRFG
jgi:tetratricopeptide (TPR) repeat protein